MIRLFTLEFKAVIQTNSLRRALGLGACFCYVVESLEATQPVTFLGTGVGLDMLGAVVSEDEKVPLARNFCRRYRPNKVSLDELVRVFGPFSRNLIKDLGCFGLLATIAYKILCIIKIENL